MTRSYCKRSPLGGERSARSVVLALVIAWVGLAAPARALNQVREERFAWRALRTEHFAIHFYGDEVEPRAREVAAWLENAFTRTTELLDVRVVRRIPVFLYRSHDHFEQTNLGAVSEGVAAFAEAARDRIVLPLYPSERFMQQVLEHELTHVVTFSALFPYRIPSFPLLKNLLYPDWFMEGIAEYVSPYRDSTVDMLIRDAALDGRMRPLHQLRSFSHLNPHEIVPAYEQSARFLEHIETTLGDGSVKRLLHVYGRSVPFRTEPVFRMALGRNFWQFEREFRRTMTVQARERVQGKGDPSPRAHALTGRGYYRTFNRSPRWSPDGRRIAFVSDRTDQTSVYVMAPDGSGRRSLLRRTLNRSLERVEAGNAALGWSPDGTRLCFIGEWVNRPYLYILDVDRGGRPRRIALPFDAIRSPAWSPDGKRIAFSAVRAGVSDIHVLDLETGRTAPLTRDRHDDRTPRWRPDGARIVYVSEREAQTDLFTVEPATGRITRLTRTFSLEREPSWSPDGTKIAYSSDAGGVYNLYVMDRRTRRAWKLTDVQGGAFSPSFSPDGKTLAFSYYRQGNMTVFRLPVDLAGEPSAVSDEADREDEYERFFTRQHPEGEIGAIRNRMDVEIFFPFILLNILTVSNLTGDQTIEAFFGPSFSSDGFLLMGDVTWWNLKYRTDLAASLSASNEFKEDQDLDGQDEELTRYGVEFQARYPFDPYRSLTAGYLAQREREYDGDELISDELRSGLFAAAEYSNLYGRGLDLVGGRQLTGRIAWFDEQIGSDTNSTDWTVGFAQYLPLARDQILAFSLRVDGSDGTDPTDLDLADVVRGVKSGTLEGQRRFGASLEFRFPIIRDLNVIVLDENFLLKDIRGYLFADAGFATVLSLDDVLDELDHPDWRRSVGIGVRFDWFVFQKIPFIAAIELAKVSEQDDVETSFVVGARLPGPFFSRPLFDRRR